MIRAYRDGYNRTNLALKLGFVRIEASATNEPWDPDSVNMIVWLGTRWLRVSLAVGRYPR